MTGRAIFVAVLVLALAAPLFAGDIVTMPTGNMVGPKGVELNAIYLNQPPSGSTGNNMVGEAFVGICKRLEVDVLYDNVKSGDNYTEVNAYVPVILEKPGKPSLILGCTNVFGQDWIMGSNEASLFALSSFTVAAPEVPTWARPMIRLHLGYGNKFHGDRLFGGVQFKFTPNWGAAILDYQAAPMYMATYCAGKALEASIGLKDGDTFYRLGVNTKW